MMFKGLVIQDLYGLSDEQLEDRRSFQRFLGLESHHRVPDAKKGQLIDASIILVPIQRNEREENEVIKEGATLECLLLGEATDSGNRYKFPQSASYNFGLA